MDSLPLRSLSRSSPILHMLEWAIAHPTKTFRLHFFESYHGGSVCDAAAKHFKERLQNVQLGYGLKLMNEEEVARFAAQGPNTTGEALPQLPAELQQKMTVRCLTGIKSAYMIEFDTPNRKVVAYNNSRKDEVVFSTIMGEVEWVAI